MIYPIGLLGMFVVGVLSKEYMATSLGLLAMVGLIYIDVEGRKKK